MTKAPSLKNRSSRNVPASTAARRSRFVAAIDPGVDLDGSFSADATDLVFLQGAQELGLHGRRDFADLVEEQRAVVARPRTVPACRARRR